MPPPRLDPSLAAIWSNWRSRSAAWSRRDTSRGVKGRRNLFVTPWPGSTTLTEYVVESATARRPSGKTPTKRSASKALMAVPVIWMPPPEKEVSF